jgi:hypothetical protein
MEIDQPRRDRKAQGPEWKACRLIDERTGDSKIGIDFPSRLHGSRWEVFDDDLTEQPNRLRKELKKCGADFSGRIAEQVRFLQCLLRQMPPEPLILAMKPGFRGDGFVLGQRMLGTARGTYRWKSRVENRGVGEIGDRLGRRPDWNRDVGEVALKSSSLTFGICTALAAPLPTYIQQQTNERLLSETAVFNLSGESGSGKTSVVRAAAGTFGPPDLLRKWDFTRRGLEEFAESRHDLLTPLDDTETHTDDISFKTALRHVNQIIPSGKSKLISNVVNLPILFWSTIGITSSPKDLESIAKELNWNRSNGERVRYIDIPVPPTSQGGIFDRLEGDELHRRETSRQLIRQLDAGVTQNYGGIMPLWIQCLLAEDCARRVLKLIDRFVAKVAGNSDGWDQRYARKFAVPAVAGYLAAQYEIVPWPKTWPIKAAAACYRRALRVTQRDVQSVAERIQLLARLSQNPERFVRVDPSTHAAIRFGQDTLGLLTQYRNKQVLAVRDECLVKLEGNRQAANTVLDRLRQEQILLGGHGHAGTTQLPVVINVGDRNINKPRFWIFDLQGLRSLAASLSVNSSEQGHD